MPQTLLIQTRMEYVTTLQINLPANRLLEGKAKIRDTVMAILLGQANKVCVREKEGTLVLQMLIKTEYAITGKQHRKIKRSELIYYKNTPHYKGGVFFI